MFPNYKQAFGIKKRNWETGKIEGFMIVGEENVKDREILIIDDICSYGNTFTHAAGALLTAGASLQSSTKRQLQDEVRNATTD